MDAATVAIDHLLLGQPAVATIGAGDGLPGLLAGIVEFDFVSRCGTMRVAFGPSPSVGVAGGYARLIRIEAVAFVAGKSSLALGLSFEPRIAFTSAMERGIYIPLKRKRRRAVLRRR
jgi:hypothetical protein